MRGKPTGIGVYCRDLMRQGYPRAAVLKKALKKFPTSVATPGCMDYYQREIKAGKTY